jgi:DNA invertase Pin-like site-specific DNA recombinase
MSDRGRKRVSIYPRVSTDDNGQDALNQILELREFASRQGWTVVREYADEATAILGPATATGGVRLSA